MRIWDTHCHPEGSKVPGRSLLEKVENLIQIADRLGTERLGLSLKPGRKDKKEIGKVVERPRRRVFGMMWMTLWKDTVANNIARLNRWVADGPMVGGKSTGESKPQDAAELTARRPECPLICDHAGRDWELSLPALGRCCCPLRLSTRFCPWSA